MGKGKRNRTDRPRGRPEMAPDVPDSTDDTPGTGRLSGYARDRLRPKVAAWTLLNAYLALVDDLGTLDPADIVPAAQSPQAVPLREDIGRMLRALHPAQVRGNADDAAQVMRWIRPRWRGVVITVLFAEAARWLRRSGSQPDERVWLSGAASYLRAMVPARHVDEALRLLDHQRLLDEQARVHALPRGQGVAAFGLEQPHATVWYATAMRAHPVAAIHAAAAVVAWVFAEPGAVLDPKGTAVELARRALEGAQLAPPGAEAPRPGSPATRVVEDTFVPAWEQPPAAGDPGGADTTQVSGEPVAVRYAGPPMTVWQAAYLYAEVITGLVPASRRETPDPDPDPDELVRVMLARAITVAADGAGLITPGQATLASPEVLAPVSLPRLFLEHLHEIGSIVEFVKPLGCIPGPDEPGHAVYARWRDELLAGGASAQQVLADPALRRRMQASGAHWQAHRERAQTAVRCAMMRVVADLMAPDAPLSLLGGHVNAYLAGGDSGGGPTGR